MTIVTHTFACVIGADTQAFPTTPAGLVRAVAWVGRRTSGLTDVLVVVEGIGSYGAGLARLCKDAGHRVVESFPTPARERRGRAKSDGIDAELIARSVLNIDTEGLRDPRQDTGVRATLRVLIGARELVNIEHTRSINALKALLRTVDLGIDARTLLTRKQFAVIGLWRIRHEDLATATVRREAIRMAKRVSACDADLAANRSEITALVAASDGAALPDEPGIGGINTAVTFSTWSHLGRVRSEAAVTRPGRPVLSSLSRIRWASNGPTRLDVVSGDISFQSRPRSLTAVAPW